MQRGCRALSRDAVCDGCVGCDGVAVWWLWGWGRADAERVAVMLPGDSEVQSLYQSTLQRLTLAEQQRREGRRRGGRGASAGAHNSSSSSSSKTSTNRGRRSSSQKQQRGAFERATGGVE